MVGILVSFWDGLFSGAMLVSGRVLNYIAPFWGGSFFVIISHKGAPKASHQPWDVHHKFQFDVLDLLGGSSNDPLEDGLPVNVKGNIGNLNEP